MNKIIVSNIYKNILEISDIQLQKSYWLGGNKGNISSYIEVMCRLFDDSDFNNFVDHEILKIGFSNTLSNQLKIFREMLTDYKEKGNDREIIEDLAWLKITEQA